MQSRAARTPNCVGFVVNEVGGAYVLTSSGVSTIFQFDAAPGVIGWGFAPDEAGSAVSGALLEAVLSELEAV